MRAKIVDVAREAGVSPATVDRVLNQRSGVKSRTRDQVLAAAEKLGYLNGATRLSSSPVSLDFILPGGTNTFLHMLAAHIEAEAGAVRPAEGVTVRVHRIDAFVPEMLAQRLNAMRDRVDGVGIVALDHPAVREAIRDLVGHGVPVLTLVSDISNVPRCGYVGIDNRAAGRLAGHLIGRFVGEGVGKIALFAGSLSYRGHGEREMGFRHMLAEGFPQLSIVRSCEMRDDADLAYREAKALLKDIPDLGGIYNVGAGNRGIARALEEADLGQRVVFVGHEVTPHTRRFLISGVMDAVIDQNPRDEAREAVARLLQAARGQIADSAPAIRIQAIFRENLPAI